MKKWRELTAEDFYARRDERTNILFPCSALRTARLTLSIDEEEAHTFSGQLTFLLLANLNARWCRDIEFLAPSISLHPLLYGFGSADLLATALGTAFAADPFGNFTPGAKHDTEARRSHVAVHTGMSRHEKAFTVIGRGWLCAAGSNLRDAGLSAQDDNPLGATVAACVGTCFAMRTALGLRPVFCEARLSLWNLENGNDAIDGPKFQSASIGRVLIVGVGAIGSSVAYILPLIRPKMSTIDLVDQDIVDYPNLNRVPAFFADDVGVPKVEVVREYLRRWQIDSSGANSWFDGASISLGDYDLVVPAANEHGIYEAVMNNVPPLMIAASTGSQWDAYRQRHIPVSEDCLCCRFPPVAQVVKLACSTGAVTAPVVDGVRAETGALPFLSVAGAVMAVTEIAKLAYEGYPRDGNYSTIWFGGDSLRFINAQKDKRKGCSYCSDPDIFRRIRGNGRFAYLTTESS